MKNYLNYPSHNHAGFGICLCYTVADTVALGCSRPSKLPRSIHQRLSYIYTQSLKIIQEIGNL